MTDVHLLQRDAQIYDCRPTTITVLVINGFQYAGAISKCPGKIWKGLGTLVWLQLNWIFGTEIPTAFPMVISIIALQRDLYGGHISHSWCFNAVPSNNNDARNTKGKILSRFTNIIWASILRACSPKSNKKCFWDPGLGARDVQRKTQSIPWWFVLQEDKHRLLPTLCSIPAL